MTKEYSNPNRAYFEFHNRRVVGPSFEDVKALLPDFYTMIYKKKVLPLDGGPVWGYGGPAEEFLPKGRKRYVFSVSLDQKPTKELLKTWRLHKTFHKIPILYSQKPH